MVSKKGSFENEMHDRGIYCQEICMKTFIKKPSTRNLIIGMLTTLTIFGGGYVEITKIYGGIEKHNQKMEDLLVAQARQDDLRFTMQDQILSLLQRKLGDSVQCR